MTDKGYNGWSNYETWNVKLWMDNDEGSYHYWRERTLELWEERDHDRDDTVNKLADALADEHTENAPTASGVYADLLNAALSEVDWQEIAEALVDDAIRARVRELPPLTLVDRVCEIVDRGMAGESDVERERR